MGLLGMPIRRWAHCGGGCRDRRGRAPGPRQGHLAAAHHQRRRGGRRRARPPGRALPRDPRPPGRRPPAHAGRQPERRHVSFAAGTYRLAVPLRPSDGQRLQADPGAVLNGAAALEGWREDGSLWWARGGLPAEPARHGECASGTLCQYRETIYLDDRPLRRVEARQLVGPGRFWADYPGDRIWIGDAAAGHLVEVARTPAAVAGRASDVEVDGFVIEQFANPAQAGAVRPTGMAGPSPTTRCGAIAAPASTRPAGGCWPTTSTTTASSACSGPATASSSRATRSTTTTRPASRTSGRPGHQVRPHRRPGHPWQQRPPQHRPGAVDRHQQHPDHHRGQPGPPQHQPRHFPRDQLPGGDPRHPRDPTTAAPSRCPSGAAPGSASPRHLTSRSAAMPSPATRTPSCSCISGATTGRRPTAPT